MKSIEEWPIKDAPVAALVDVAVKAKADLLVVGNVGLNARYAIIGRLFSIPGKVSRRAKTDVLIVNTTGLPADRPTRDQPCQPVAA